jgi:nucleotide-binding universal stress UspA family protein
MWKRILVPLDGSVEGEAVVAQLRRFLAGEARVTLLHVIPGVMTYAGEDGEQTRAIVASAEKYLHGIAVKLDGRASVFVDFGDTAERILCVARSIGADLIAMGTLARRGGSKPALGSVASHVLRESPCPVMLVRPGLYLPLRPVRRVMVALDDPQRESQLVDAVGPTAAALGAEVILLAVGAPERSENEPVGPRARLRDAARELQKADVASWPVVVNGEPVEEITRQGAWFDVDLIAISARSAGGRRIIGSGVAEGVLRRADRPVLIVKRGMPS